MAQNEAGKRNKTQFIQEACRSLSVILRTITDHLRAFRKERVGDGNGETS